MKPAEPVRSRERSDSTLYLAAAERISDAYKAMQRGKPDHPSIEQTLDDVEALLTDAVNQVRWLQARRLGLGPDVGGPAGFEKSCSATAPDRAHYWVRDFGRLPIASVVRGTLKPGDYCGRCGAKWNGATR